MDRIAVDSTTLAWVTYSPDQRLLELGFHTGEVYNYLAVPSGTYHELLRADSKGRYFNLHIRNHFRAHPVRARAAG
jgi:hypothetical protein